MVKHIIFFTLKEGADKDAVFTAAEKALMPLVGKIPGLTKWRSGGASAVLTLCSIPSWRAGKPWQSMPTTPPILRPRATSFPGSRAERLPITKYKEREI